MQICPWAKKIPIRFLKRGVNETPQHKIVKIHRNQFLSLGWKALLTTDEDMGILFLWNTTLRQEGSRIPTPLEYLARSCNNCQGHCKYGQHIHSEGRGPISPWEGDTLRNTAATTQTRHDVFTPQWAMVVKKLCMRISTEVVGKKIYIYIFFSWEVSGDLNFGNTDVQHWCANLLISVQTVADVLGLSHQHCSGTPRQ